MDGLNCLQSIYKSNEKQEKKLCLIGLRMNW